MVLLCFMLDLRTLSPPLLAQLKQCLLQLANLYAIGSGNGDRQSEKLIDRIGLCYIQKNRESCSDELKVVYCPRGNFSLRDFHHAVNYLPAEDFDANLVDTEATKISGTHAMLARLLSKEFLYSWGSEDMTRKVIFVSSCLVEDIDSFSLRRILIDAADKNVSVDFLVLEQELGQPNLLSQNVQEIVNIISDQENCSIQRHIPDSLVLRGLVKQWLRQLEDNVFKPLQAVFLFKNDLAGSVNQIFCNLYTTVKEMVDGFGPCKELEAANLIENVVKVGEQTILFLPSFQGDAMLQPISAPITFHVIERTSLSTLSEGVIIGGSYIVAPLASHVSEATSDDKSELNTQLFQGLCLALHSMDQGLVCTSNCNMETMREASFKCFYILLPSEDGPMLLRKLAGSEEILSIPDAIKSLYLSVPVEMQNSVQTSLSKIKLLDYNPHYHERGLHTKLNNLVKESLQFGSIPPLTLEMNLEPNSMQLEFSEVSEIPASSEKELDHMPLVSQGMEEYKYETTTSLTAEWEQLTVIEDPNNSYANRKSIPWTKIPLSSPLAGNKQPSDDRTLRILERLEGPRHQKTKGSSNVLSSIVPDGCLHKNPLVPSEFNHTTNQETTLSQPMRPSFQRLKRRR